MPEAKPGGWPETFLGVGWEMACRQGMFLPWEEGVLCLLSHLGRVWVPCLLGEERPLLGARMGSSLMQGDGVLCLCSSHPSSSGTGRPILGRNLS